MLWKVHFRLSLCRQVREKVETCHLSLRSWPRQRRLYYILIRFHVIDLDYWILFLYQQFIRNGRGSHGKNKWCAPLQGFYTSAATNMNASTNRQVLLLNLASTSSSNYTSSTSSSTYHDANLCKCHSIWIKGEIIQSKFSLYLNSIANVNIQKTYCKRNQCMKRLKEKKK